MKKTDTQKWAIAALKRALGSCERSGVRLFGMDNVLYATVSHDDHKDFHQQYQEASGGDSDLMEPVASGRVFIGSGGW